MTCDNNRPCERCVQRGLAATCRDGTRKKAKYLQDVPDSLTPTATADGSRRTSAGKKGSGGTAKNHHNHQQPHAHPHAQPPKTEPGLFRHPSTISDSTPASISTNSYFPPSDSRNSSISSTMSAPAGSTSSDLTSAAVAAAQHPHSHRHRHHFQSTAINSEYRVLSNILTGNPATDTATGGVSLQDLHTGGGGGGNSGSSPAQSEDSPLTDPNSYNGTVYQSNVLNHFTLGGSTDEKNLMDILSTVDEAYNHGGGHVPGPQPGDWMGDSPNPKRPISFAITDYETQPVERPPNGLGVLADIAPFSSNAEDWRTLKEPGDIYSKIRKPYSYTPAYHALSAYLKSRFDKDRLLKMAKCMASYRPSFIACTNTLKEDDLIFMEQCFQRTLLEYEKFISYSGTPTIIWRRTGQITAVGKEFCILTGWTKERLLGQRTFIVELMDDDSVVEYFQMFSNIAFGDSRGAMMSECTLLTPNGQKLKTSSMWTLKRDVFGIPMMIIGNFLPILT